MSKASLGRIIIALAIVSLYVYAFGVIGTVGTKAETAPPTETAAVTEPAVSEQTSAPEETAPLTAPSAEKTLPPPSITSYDTTINTANDKKPTLADYTAGTTAYRESSMIMELAETTAETTVPPIEAVDETTVPSETTTTAEPSTTTTTAATTAATTTPLTTTTTTPLPIEDEPEDIMDEVFSETEGNDDELLADEPESEQTDDEELDAEEPEEAPTQTTAPPAFSETATLKVHNTSTGKIVEGGVVSIVSRIVQNEIGSSFSPEAIKAQAIVAYTYAKYYNDNGEAAQVKLATVASDTVIELVTAVAGKAIYYDGGLIQAVYGASSAGYTASSENVWGVSYPYLLSTKTDFDAEYDPNYGVETVWTADEMRSIIAEKTGIALTGDPSEWFKITSHTDGVYVDGMTIGGNSTYLSGGDTVNITGRRFRENIMSYNIKSACFTIDYTEQTESFTITTYGYGHGVGLSQNGANILATYYGYTYDEIIDFYFKGATIQ